MNKIKTILVAVDFSTGSHTALLQAARIASLNEAKLHVLHVVDAEAVATLADMREESYERHAKTAVDGANAALLRWLERSVLPVGYEITIATGTPLHEILEHALALHADLLVAGITGRGNAPAGTGSVSARIARHSQIPLLLVRSSHSHAFRKIVACIDFSDTAKEVARQAQREAVQDAAHVDFLHVWREPCVIAPYDDGLAMQSTYPVITFTAQERAACIQNLQQELHEFVARTVGDFSCGELVSQSIIAAEGIITHAEESKTDLIVVGSKGRTNLRYVLLGSTAERLLTRLPCSLLVVPAEKPLERRA